MIPDPSESPSSAAGHDEAQTRFCPHCAELYPASALFCPADGAALKSLSQGADLIGQVIADRYLIHSTLGAGAMGQVYLAEHIRMGRSCAVKVIKEGLLQNPDAILRFNREASNASRITHSNVAAIYDCGETPDGLVYLAMEYVEGETLSQCLEHEQTLAPRRAAGIVWQIAEGLTAAHDLQIIHRDLKPDNIMLGRRRDGTDGVKVVDFGVARVIGESQKVTSTGLVVGTPLYMSPEQLAGDPIDTRSDVYALGLMTVWMLTGTVPFSGRTPQEALAARIRGRSRVLDSLRADMDWPDELHAVVDRVLASDRVERYATARGFARDLAKVITEWQPSPGDESDPWVVTVRHMTPIHVATLRSDTTPADQPAVVSGASAGKASSQAPVPEPIESRSRSWRGARWLGAGAAALVLVLAAASVKLMGGTRGDTSLVTRAGADGSAGELATRKDDPRTKSPATRLDRRKDTPGAGSGSSGPVDPRAPEQRGEEKAPQPPPDGSATGLDPRVARLVLDSVAVLTGDSLATDAMAQSALDLVARVLPHLTNREDSVEAQVRAIEAHLVLDDTAAACRIVVALRRAALGTSFERTVRAFSQDAQLACR